MTKTIVKIDTFPVVGDSLEEPLKEMKKGLISRGQGGVLAEWHRQHERGHAKYSPKDEVGAFGIIDFDDGSYQPCTMLKRSLTQKEEIESILGGLCAAPDIALLCDHDVLRLRELANGNETLLRGWSLLLSAR